MNKVLEWSGVVCVGFCLGLGLGYAVDRQDKAEAAAVALAHMTEWDPAPKNMRQYCLGAYVWMVHHSQGNIAQVWEAVDGVALPMTCD